MSFENFIAINEVESVDELTSLADKFGEVVIIKDNKPMYRFIKVGSANDIEELREKRVHIDLWEAMDLVLSEKDNQTMHVKEIAEEITARGLYFMKDGSAVGYNQIRARATHKPEFFECLEGNYIRLIKRYKK